MIKQNKENNFSILRIAAALMVMSGHMSYIIATPLIKLFGANIQELGVAIFFLIGGYLISQSWLSEPVVVRYSVKRIFRIWPPLICFTLLAALVIGPFLSYLPLKEYYAHPLTDAYLKNIFLEVQYGLPGVFEQNPYPNAVNGSLWTLPVEILMYAAVPVVLSLCRVKKEGTGKKSWMLLAAVTVLLCTAEVVYQILGLNWRFVVYATDWVSAFHIIPYYFIGMLYGNPRVKAMLNLPVAIFLVLVGSCFDFSYPARKMFLFVVFSYFVFSIAFAPANRLSKFFDKYEISYGIYLYGFFVQQVVVFFAQKLQVQWSHSVYLAVCAAVTVVLSLLSFRFIEKPAAAASKKVLKKLRGAQAT